VLSIGLFEGLYNHVLKNILFLSGAPASVLLRMFPPPTYELPNDAGFEVSGVAQVIPAAFTALALLRFARARGTSASRILPGAVLSERKLTTTTGEAVRIPDAVQLVHLQFRRFAGCPVCNLHLHSLVQRQHEIAAAGIREVVVFHSTTKELLLHTADLPFAVIADPDQRLYADFGVESAPRALLDPRAWGPVVRAVARSLVSILRGQGRAPAASPLGGRLGLPADLLIASSGRVIASKYGRHVYDQWSVDELLELARAAVPDRLVEGARTL
jgi:peroxiredoxin